MSFNPQWIVGKTIARVEMRPFKNGRGREITFDPLIVFRDGSSIAFNVDETEHGEYGVSIAYMPKHQRPSTRKPDAPPRIVRLSDDMLATLYAQLPTSMQQRICGFAHNIPPTPFVSLSQSQRDHVLNYITGHCRAEPNGDL